MMAQPLLTNIPFLWDSLSGQVIDYIEFFEEMTSVLAPCHIDAWANKMNDPMVANLLGRMRPKRHVSWFPSLPVVVSHHPRPLGRVGALSTALSPINIQTNFF